MSLRSLLPLLLFTCACATGGGPGFAEASAQTPAGETGANAAAVADAPQRLHIIGASVSGGFEDGPLFGASQQGDSVPLQQILRKWCGEHCKVSAHSTVEMTGLFTDPLGIGEKEVAVAKNRKPDVVIAVDFLFWFAYGYVQGDDATARAELLQTGLGYLKELEVPVVIGDLPDMTGAATRMLSPRQVPKPATLAALNETLREFDAARADVVTVPLAGFVAEMRGKGVVLQLQDGPLATAPGALQQEDRLHATRLGMAVLGLRMQDTLRGLFPAGHPLHEQRWTLEQFVEAAGAEEELELLQEKAAAAGGK